jgi:hypothetical protein
MTAVGRLLLLAVAGVVYVGVTILAWFLLILYAVTHKR